MGWHVRCSLSLDESDFMVGPLFQQPNYVALKKMMDATMLRQEAISSNLANLETPGYKRVDVSPTFSTQLQEKIRAKDPSSLGSLTPDIVPDPSAVAANRDGNTVNLEQELMHLSKNTLSHTLETQLMTGNLLKLRLAITGRG